MIDVHCHLCQLEYNSDRDKIIQKCKERIRAVITSCAHPRDLDLTLDLVKKYPGFVFGSFGFHPQYAELSDEEIESYINKIRKNASDVVGVGEIGLEYFMVKGLNIKEKQKLVFRRMIELANSLGKPVVIHSRKSDEDVLEILESVKTGVYWHLFGNRKILKDVDRRGYYIGVGPLILRSKGVRKIVRDFPFERILLETDSPWFGVPEDFGKKYAQGGIVAPISEGADINDKMFKVRGYPWNIKYAAEKIAEIKKVSFEEVWEICGRNAVRFFKLPVKI